MDARAALAFIAAAVGGGRVRFTFHAQHESMPDRGLEIDDVIDALRTADVAEAQNDTGTKWLAIGTMTSGERLAVVVRFRDDVLVITAYNL